MNESQISVRYAKALFQSALESKELDKVYADMELLSQVCKMEDFEAMLVLPSLQPGDKCKITAEIFSKKMTDKSLALIDLVIRNKRELYLTGIARNFIRLYREEKGIRTATLYTAEAVDKGTGEEIKKLIAKLYNSEVELSSEVDAGLIGGFVLTVEDMRYDASVATSLKKMRNQLLQTSTEK
ncbi:MAG: ATP synthase F1 subunit delta [Bacteroidetes bacterium]|nr:MAG: ATP synthase F1 subunit delta [Bacteroidota bacterium]